MLWSVVVPVKRLGVAKSRLRLSLARADQESLVLAMALDTVTAVLACPAVQQVVVVTDDALAGAAAASCGAHVVPDAPAGGLNLAVEYGAVVARRLAPGCGTAALGGDLPALRVADLTEALAAAAAAGRAFVADAAGCGTTLLAAAPDRALAPAYGPDSAAAHAASGAVALVDSRGGAQRWASLRQDVDTAEDLNAALALGVGRHTAARKVLSPTRP